MRARAAADAAPGQGGYLRRMAAAAVALWALMAAWTLAVDPYGLFRLVEAEGFNRAKSDSFRIDQLLDYLERRPALVLFGSSRVRAFAVPLRERDGEDALVYALPALKAIELLPLLAFLQERAPPRRVLIGLDFFAFNAAATVAPPQYARLDRLFWPDFLFRNVLSWDVFREGVRVVARNLDEGALAAEAEAESQQAALRAGTAPDRVVRTTYVNAVGFYLDRSYYGGYRFDAAAADGLQALLARLAEEGVGVQLFVNPPHVALLATIRLAGYWPAYEAFHRRLLVLAEAEGLELWDFAGVTPLSTEPVGGGMQWYTDPSHFKPAYARLMLARLDGEASDPSVGVRLRPDMLEAHLAARRQALDDHLARHPELVALVREGALQAGVELPPAPGP